jgi:hypothetical protein
MLDTFMFAQKPPQEPAAKEKPEQATSLQLLTPKVLPTVLTFSPGFPPTR